MKHAFAGLIGDRQRQIIHAVVDEIIANPGEEYGLKLMPPVLQPAAVLIHERISGGAGITGERALGEKGKAVSAGSSKTRIFEPGAYQEHIRFGEKDMLMLRKFGTIGDPWRYWPDERRARPVDPRGQQAFSAA